MIFQKERKFRNKFIFLQTLQPVQTHEKTLKNRSVPWENRPVFPILMGQEFFLVSLWYRSVFRVPLSKNEQVFLKMESESKWKASQLLNTEKFKIWCFLSRTISFYPTKVMLCIKLTRIRKIFDMKRTWLRDFLCYLNCC